MQSVVMNIAVVNDAAERSVKDVQDFTNAAKDGSYQGPDYPCIKLSQGKDRNFQEKWNAGEIVMFTPMWLVITWLIDSMH